MEKKVNKSDSYNLSEHFQNNQENLATTNLPWSGEVLSVFQIENNNSFIRSASEFCKITINVSGNYKNLNIYFPTIYTVKTV